MNDLLNGLKDNLLIPREVSDYDTILTTYLTGAKSYIDSILDVEPPENDKLYQLALLNLASYQWLNRDNPKLKNLPITINSLLNRLKYSNQP